MHWIDRVGGVADVGGVGGVRETGCIEWRGWV